MTLKLPDIFRQGVHAMQGNNRLLIIGVLALIFPALFFYVFNGFLSTARSNSETTEKQKVALLHDAVVTLAKTDSTGEFLAVGNYLDTVRAENSEVTDMRLVAEENATFIIKQAFLDEQNGTADSRSELYQLSKAGNGQSLIFASDGSITSWQAVRAFQHENRTYFVLSEHSFAAIDAVFAARERQAFLLLSVMFAFFIATAYWLASQINWHAKYKQIEVQLEERNLFTNMIAHEFRTPLTAIRGYNSFLAESQALSEKEKTFVEAIKQSTDRQLALVNDFLEVARIQAGKLSLKTQTVDIQPTIVAVLSALKTQAEAKNLTLTYHQLAVPVVLSVDTDRLFQVLQNLVSNSIKYTEKGGIDITLDATPLAVSIRIKDTGMGISAEDQQKLFAPFARVGGVEHTKITGTGLGMWITKQLVEALKGSITIESIKGVGTHVIVTFRR